MNVPPVGSERGDGSASSRTGAAGHRMRRAWRALHADQRIAAAAALALFVTMFLPWYAAPEGALTRHHTAIATFGWIELSILLVAMGALWMLFARAERRAFHLPGGDGSVITAAGLWVCVLFVWRLFDRPSFHHGVATDLSWGIFVALAAGIALAYAGTRIRAAGRPEPPLVDHDRDGDRVVVPDERPWLDETEQIPSPEARRRYEARRAAEDRPRAHPAEIPEPADPPAPPDSLRSE